MSQNSNAIVIVRRALPDAEGRRKATIGTIPTQTNKEAVDAAFTHAEVVIDRFRYSAESGCSPEEWEQLLDGLKAIENNPANSGGLRRKAGFLKREMRRQERRYSVDFGSKTGGSGGGGNAKTKARKAAKAAASRELRARMKSPKRG